jgi:acetyl esterase/lipase
MAGGDACRQPLAADLASRGYAVWNLEYRRSFAGGGWPATFADVVAVGHRREA